MKPTKTQNRREEKIKQIHNNDHSISQCREKKQKVISNLEYSKIQYLEKENKTQRTFQSSTHHEHAIDTILQKYNLYRLDNFAYTVGDCLFDTFQVLLYNIYTSIELREGIIQHFEVCLAKKDREALVSYQHELNKYSLMEMHNVNDPKKYLQ